MSMTEKAFDLLKTFSYYQNGYQQLVPKKSFCVHVTKEAIKMGWCYHGVEKKGHLRVVQVWQSLLVPYELGN